MSKYPVRYWSESKKAKVRIEDMATPWLANAWRKLGEAVDKHESGEPPHPDAASRLREAMSQELVSRGCTYDAETGQWTFPPKPEAEP